MTRLSFDIYLRATPGQVRTVLTDAALVPSWLAGMQLQNDEAEHPDRLTCEWLQTGPAQCAAAGGRPGPVRRKALMPR